MDTPQARLSKDQSASSLASTSGRGTLGTPASSMLSTRQSLGNLLADNKENVSPDGLWQGSTYGDESPFHIAAACKASPANCDGLRTPLTDITPTHINSFARFESPNTSTPNTSTAGHSRQHLLSMYRSPNTPSSTLRRMRTL